MPDHNASTAFNVINHKEAYELLLKRHREFVAQIHPIRVKLDELDKELIKLRWAAFDASQYQIAPEDFAKMNDDQQEQIRQAEHASYMSLQGAESELRRTQREENKKKGPEAIGFEG